MPHLFPLGRVVATPGALQVLAEWCVSPLQLLNRHVAGDWGTIHPEDRGLNEKALLWCAALACAQAETAQLQRAARARRTGQLQTGPPAQCAPPCRPRGC